MLPTEVRQAAAEMLALIKRRRLVHQLVLEQRQVFLNNINKTRPCSDDGRLMDAAIRHTHDDDRMAEICRKIIAQEPADPIPAGLVPKMNAKVKRLRFESTPRKTTSVFTKAFGNN